MPELPEVHTTVEGLKKVIIGKTIKDVWSDFHIGTAVGARQTIKNRKYFEKFRKIAMGAKIKSLERRGKNILIHLNPSTSSGQVKHTIVVHMKMTGHLMVGKYKFQNYVPSLSTDISLLGNSSARPVGLRKARSGNNLGTWQPTEKGPLQDSFNKFIHLVFSLSNNPSTSSGQAKHLVLSDMRKFASVTIYKTEELHKHETLAKLGPDPLNQKLSAKKFFEIIHNKKGMPIKSSLLDQSAVSGIGNIYSDEILWETGVHPFSKADKIPEKKLIKIFGVAQKILRFSIKHGGDSKSDYRNAFGEKGRFQNFHKAYGKKGEKCQKKNCLGIIRRTMIRGRSAHFCPKHQIKHGG